MTPPRLIRKKQSLRSSSNIGESFRKRKHVNCHHIENTTTGLNYDLMPPTLSTAKYTPSPKVNKRCSTSTSQTTWKRDILWHHPHVMVLPRLWSRKRMAHSEL